LSFEKKNHQSTGNARNMIPIRLNILFGVVILLFTVLIVRLADMQIVNHDFYSNKLATASQKVVTKSSVRGLIYDAKGKPLVENQIQQVVSFTRSNKMTAEEMKQVAKIYFNGSQFRMSVFQIGIKLTTIWQIKQSTRKC
jgi:penicillin-binding protein 2B